MIENHISNTNNYRICGILYDENYWKDRYKDWWDVAADKEEKIKTIIEKECNCECEYAGLGAGSTKYLPGSAKSRGYKKGGSDLYVKDTNIYVEVTGPNVPVGRHEPLWIRPDKIENAIENRENDYWVVHILPQDFFVRVIHIDGGFKKDYQNDVFELVHPVIRGTREEYVAIPAESKHVTIMEALLESIKEALDFAHTD